jgi:GNAT superfamily N-acetyltransferase
MEFAKGAKADLRQLIELLGILFQQEADFSPDREKQEAGLSAILSDVRIGQIFVAREDGRAVAMASLLYTVSTAEGGKVALFEDLVVLPEYRGRGIGAGLLEHVIAQARAEGVLRLTLLTDRDNARAQALYANAGFRPSGMLAMRLHL